MLDLDEAEASSRAPTRSGCIHGHKRKLTLFGHQVRREKITKDLIQDICEGVRTRERRT